MKKNMKTQRTQRIERVLLVLQRTQRHYYYYNNYYYYYFYYYYTERKLLYRKHIDVLSNVYCRLFRFLLRSDTVRKVQRKTCELILHRK